MAGARMGSPGIHTALSVLETIVARGPLTLWASPSLPT